MSKLVRLSVHKNTVERRRTKEVREAFKDKAREIQNMKHLQAYVIVGWDRDGGSIAHWRVSTGLDAAQLPDFTRNTLVRHQIADETE